MNDKSQDKPKTRTYTEEEFNKKLTESLNSASAKPFRYIVDMGTAQYQNKVADLSPFFSITVKGGDYASTHKLGLEVEQLILTHAKSLT